LQFYGCCTIKCSLLTCKVDSLGPVKETALLYKYTNTWVQHNYKNETKNTDKAKCEY